MDTPSHMRFQAWPAVAVKIRHGKSSGLAMYSDPTNLVRKFFDFCNGKGWHVHAHVAGPSELEASVFILDKEGRAAENLTGAIAEITAWFADNGAGNVCLSCGAGEGEDHDETKHRR